MQNIIITIAAVVLVGCVPKQLQKTKAVPIQQAEPPTAKAPEISIHEAVIGGNIAAVKQHLVAGTNVDVKGGFSDGTPLLYAAAQGHKEIVELQKV